MSDRNISGGSDVVPLQTKAVQDAPQSLASSPAAFLDYMCGPVEPTPLIFRAAEQSREPGRTRGQEFLETLRAAGDRMVEIEAGRDVDLDECLHLPHDHRVTVPLNAYLDWLCDGTAEFPQAPWYLAQWYAQDEVPGMRDAVRAPSLLTPLIEDSKADMYRCGFFIGPPTAISPLHSDPYCNLYTLHVSSDASTHAKHWLLLPPSLGKPLAPPSHGYAQPNMSPLDCRLRRRQDEDGGFDVLMDRTSVPGQTALDVLDAGVALSCVMREGDMLFVPRRAVWEESRMDCWGWMVVLAAKCAAHALASLLDVVDAGEAGGRPLIDTNDLRYIEYSGTAHGVRRRHQGLSSRGNADRLGRVIGLQSGATIASCMCVQRAETDCHVLPVLDCILLQ